MLYQVSISCNPKHGDQWFRGQAAKDVIEGRDLNDAQEKLDIWCRSYGTDNDPYFVDGGPCAVPAVAYKYTDPEEGPRYMFDEVEAEEIAREDPSLILWLEEE